ncbi:[Citrate [pro-3S]-lyase] ligase [Spirochaetia bacterium]|nr:[Citrate [pro-3S]-lyase] ligase [Spirochaetia bacterium]
MDLRCGFPFRASALEKLRSFLFDCGLKYDDRVRYSVCLMDEEGRIAATGSLDGAGGMDGGAVLKCIAVSPDYQSEGLAARVVTELVNHAGRNGQHHLFLFTKPAKEALFSGLGFYPIAKTAESLLMENKKNGVADFVAGLERPAFSDAAGAKNIGAIVVNCNPFTKGHLYLIETAAKQCDALHLFIVSEDQAAKAVPAFPADVRRNLVLAGIAHLPRVYPHPTGPYLISAATFPDYFLKDGPGAIPPETVNTRLDLAIFAERFALPLGINCRFVGTEPMDPLTREYNRQMREVLPAYGVKVVEIPRLEAGGAAISAGRVRQLLREGNLQAIKELVPPATFAYLETNHG